MADAVEKEVCSGVAPLLYCRNGKFCTVSEKMSPQNEIFRHRKWGESPETLFLPTFFAHNLTREGDWGWGCSIKWGILQLQPSIPMSAMAGAAVTVRKEVCSSVLAPLFILDMVILHFF